MSAFEGYLSITLAVREAGVEIWKRSLLVLGLLFASTGDVWAECSGSAETCNDGNIYAGLSGSGLSDNVRWNQQSPNVTGTGDKDDMRSSSSQIEPQNYHENRLRPIYGTDSEGRPQMYACDPYSGCR
jgi:hypothetical protein